MTGLEPLERLLAYDGWANLEALAFLERAGSPASPRCLRFLSHIIGAERLWLARLRREKSALAVWPDLTLEECRLQLEELSRVWPAFLRGLDAAGLWQSVAYVNSKGEPWSSTVEDILIHVVMHSVYHRGQIAADLRASGREPAYTDFIHAVRQGFVR